MPDDLNPANEICGIELGALPDKVLNGGRPIVLRSAVKHWPFVQAALQSNEAAIDYIERFYNGRPVNMIVAPASEHGRFFYRPHSKRMNFESSSAPLPNILRALVQEKDSDRPFGVAAQAISAPDCLPGLQDENPNPLVPADTQARVWIGNAVTVAPHFDVSDNIACVVAGRRRFILFPPEQTANIYPGPMDVTPANVPISMVSLEEPELERFPRYRQALRAALVAELEPGDAIYIPYLWWHGVQSLGVFNILMNYWWNDDDRSARYPYVAILQLAYKAFRDMPPEHRNAWRGLYDHYVFQAGGDPMEALSPEHGDARRPLNQEEVGRLKQMLRQLLG